MQSSAKKRQKIFRILAVFLGIQIILSIGLSNLLATKTWAGVLPAGVSIAGESVGGYDRAQVRLFLEQETQGFIQNTQLNLTLGEQNWALNLERIGGRIDYDKIVEQVFWASRGDQWGQQVVRAWQLFWQPVDIPIQITYNEELLRNQINEIADAYNLPAEDAQFIWSEARITRGFEISPERIGREIDVERSLEKIRAELVWGNNVPIQLVETILQPRRFSSDFAGVQGILSTAIINLDPRESLEANNLDQATFALNRTLLKPGEELALSQLIQSESPEIDASIGADPILSALEKAVQRANLEVRETAPGDLNTFVVGQNGDFRFANSTSQPLLITAEIKPEPLELAVRFFGSN